MEHTTRGHLTRRALLGTTVSGLIVSGCSSLSSGPAAPKPVDPQVVLLRSLIAAKEQMIQLYQRGALSEDVPAAALAPFQERHAAHLAAFRKLLPPDATAAPSPAVTPSPAPTSAVSVKKLRDAERKAAAGRPAQMAQASPALSQLLASVGACEAVHVMALGGLRG
ncbi:hypothetical protein GCM10023194_14490 [Planotetraspora phitsanulokensis]|uniref:Lipoprotein n=1 Tax=Planotetraspora phitsanulokensis TaxID=575192 RepID=A0A8J3U5E2_9ACTN|nr:hypothetical protein [Planotetraspora phitsanulokensis]GII38938.1 hypothetical protein Pph01_39410 [Planotetraspora phitsanulokensis]